MIQTQRILLRRWKPEDRAPFARLNADPKVMEFMPACLTRAESDRWIDQIESEFDRDGFGLWAIELPGIAPFIGFTGLNWVPFTASFTPAVEIGWRLAAEFWGQGLATEAAAAALECGFADYGLEEIVAETAVLNTRSRRVMSRLNMRHDGEFLHPSLPADHALKPHVLYRLGVSTTRPA